MGKGREREEEGREGERGERKKRLGQRGTYWSLGQVGIPRRSEDISLIGSMGEKEV